MTVPASPPSPASGMPVSTSHPSVPLQPGLPSPQTAPSPSEDSLMTPRAPNHNETYSTLHKEDLEKTLHDGYFTANAINSHSVDPHSVREMPRASLALPSLTNASVNASAPTIADLPSSASSLEHFQDSPRSPIQYESLSPTIHPSNSTSPARTGSSHAQSSTEYPHYPDQSFKALQTQIHRGPHRPVYSIRKGSSAYLTSSHSSSTVPVLPAVPAYLTLTDERGSKTVGNSPASTPGLFTPKPRHQFGSDADDGSDRSHFPSPSLHPVQPHPPRETHKAEKDVDTFSGRKRINQYEIREELGRGVHGKVKLARSLETGDYVAIKIVQRYPKKHRLGKADAPENKVKREVAILKKVSHQNVVSMLEVIDDPAYAKIYIVLEFCELKEVDWRTLGDSAIVYLEEVRQKRVASGIDSPTLTNQEQRLLKSAHKREKKRHDKWRKQQRLDGSLQFWSLEFADDSETESSRSISRTSSAQTDSMVEMAKLSELSEEDGTDLHSFSNEDNVITPVPGAHGNNLAHYVSPTHEEQQSGIDHRSHGEPEVTGEVESVELNTIINDLSRGRKGSVADSLNSQLTEAMEEEVIEDHRYVPVMTIQESRAAFRDALLGLEYLHYQGIIHRDIKPANLLRTKDHRVKISDFGVSYLGKPMREGRESEDVSENESQDLDDEVTLAQTVGTPAFYAPELCSMGITSDTVVTGQIDVWALGVTLYCLLFARTPFTAENTFALMKSIAEDDVFIPRQRLKAVEPRPSSRSGSRVPRFRSAQNDRRMPNEIQYDDIDDDLFDLMKRLLIKDPKLRITIKEIKHHPWVLADIQDKAAWIEETDPGRHTEGKKIEISNKEVAEAVVPLKLVDRVKSAARKFTGAIGLGGSRKDSPTSGHVTSPIAAQAMKDGHKSNSRVDESIMSALVASRGLESDHHLSNSITAGQASHHEIQNQHDQISTSVANHPAADVDFPSNIECASPVVEAYDNSASASIKTVKAQSLDRGRGTPPSPALTGFLPVHEPSTPTTTLGGLLNGAGQKLMRSMRSRDRGSRKRDASSASPARDTPDVTEDAHGRPSIAISAAHVSGFVGRGIDRSPAGSARASPASSPAPSTNPSSDRLYPPLGSTPIHNQSQANTSTSRHLRSMPLSLGGGLSRDAAPYSPIDGDPSEEELAQVREQLNRRRLLEDERMSASTNSSRPASAGLCPPSPDDDIYNEKQLTAQAQAQAQAKPTHHTVSTEPASVKTTVQAQPDSSEIRDLRAVSSSSEDRFASGTSQSTFPSMQSMLSADSSVVPEESSSQQLKEDSSNSSDTANPGYPLSPIPTHSELEMRLSAVSGHSSSGFLSRSEDEGYVGDDAVETDEDVADSDSESDGDFIVMTKRKNTKDSTPSRKNTGSDDGLHVDKSRLKTPLKKSVRSGSSNTVKEVGPETAKGDFQSP